MATEAPVIDIGKLRLTCTDCGLQQLCLPAAIPDADLLSLDRLVKRRPPIERGKLLYGVGNRLLALYVVRSGSFKTWVGNAQGENQVLGFHLPGDIIGFDAVSNDLHQCSAEALETTTVCEIPYPQLSQVAAQVPALQSQLLRVISRETLRDQQHLMMMGRRQAQERLAIFLRSMIDRNRRLKRDPATLNLAMSRYDLANYLGLVVETVSRLFTKFQQAGVLDVRRKTIRILSIDKLDELTGQAEPDQVCQTNMR
jgi:CRP/FNR family transcriptional regulator